MLLFSPRSANASCLQIPASRNSCSDCRIAAFRWRVVRTGDADARWPLAAAVDASTKRAKASAVVNRRPPTLKVSRTTPRTPRLAHRHGVGTETPSCWASCVSVSLCSLSRSGIDSPSSGLHWQGKRTMAKIESALRAVDPGILRRSSGASNFPGEVAIGIECCVSCAGTPALRQDEPIAFSRRRLYQCS